MKPQKGTMHILLLLYYKNCKAFTIVDRMHIWHISTDVYGIEPVRERKKEREIEGVPWDGACKQERNTWVGGGRVKEMTLWSNSRHIACQIISDGKRFR